MNPASPFVCQTESLNMFQLAHQEALVRPVLPTSNSTLDVAFLNSCVAHDPMKMSVLYPKEFHQRKFRRVLGQLKQLVHRVQ